MKDAQDLHTLLMHIGVIAHCGGHGNLDVNEAMTAIRKLSTHYWDKSASASMNKTSIGEALVTADRIYKEATKSIFETKP
jgi:hypothetical protein